MRLLFIPATARRIASPEAPFLRPTKARYIPHPRYVRTLSIILHFVGEIVVSLAIISLSSWTVKPLVAAAAQGGQSTEYNSDRE